MARGLARFGLLVERLEKSLPKEGSKRLPEALTAQLLATAATASRSSRELEENLARLSRIGVDVPPATPSSESCPRASRGGACR